MSQLIIPAIGITSVIFTGLYTVNNRLDKIEHKFIHNELRQEDNMHHFHAVIREMNGRSGADKLEVDTWLDEDKDIV